MKTSIPFFLALASLSSLGLSCTTLECGEGTIEEDGVCIGTASPQNPGCAPGTIFNAQTGLCQPDYCNTGTAEPECGFCPAGADPTPNPVTGVIECIGGGEQTCQDDIIDCPIPAPGKVMVCGNIFDLQTSMTIKKAAIDPAALQVQFYDALGFATATDPEDRPEPLLTGTIDACGHFQSTNANSDTGIDEITFVAIAIDDKGAGDSYALTGVGAPGTAGTRVFVNGYVTRKDTLEVWDAAAGAPSEGFEQRGALVPIYLSKEATALPDYTFEGEPVGPVPGVKVAGLGLTEEQVFYFDDADPGSRASLVDAQLVTGQNGSAVVINAALVNYGGTGPEPCAWTPALSGSVTGVIFVAERHSSTPGCM